MKRIGPDLKMPKLKGGEMKVPTFVSDLYYDLHDRRLLPLVALILVAIVATPILLAGGSEESEFASPPPATGAATTPAAREASLAVVEVNPGLREYRKRLKRRKPTDPFHQRFTGPVLKGAHLQSQSSTSSSSSSTTVESGTTATTEGTVTGPPVTSGSGSSGGGDSDGDGIPNGVSLYTYVLDLQITRIQTKPDGKVEKIGPKLHKNVKAPTALPGEKAPVVTYLGMGAKEPRRPMFLVSPEVTAIFGESTCIAGTGSCQLIALEKGFPVTLVYGENDVRYKINLVDVTPVPVKAPS